MLVGDQQETPLGFQSLRRRNDEGLAEIGAVRLPGMERRVADDEIVMAREPTCDVMPEEAELGAAGKGLQILFRQCNAVCLRLIEIERRDPRTTRQYFGAQIA